MGQLPPKIPTFTPCFHKNPATATFFPPAATTAAAAAAAWMDEFLDFSATRRSAHRRSASDSITFLEAPEADDFDRLDEDQLLSMFSDQVAPSHPAAEAAPAPSNASTPSDNSSVNEARAGGERKMEGEGQEAQSKYVDRAPPAAAASNSQSPPPSTAPEQPVDTKRVRR